MDSVIFKVSKDVNKTFAIPSNEIRLKIKRKNKRKLYNISSYIDIDFNIEKPMRVLGKI